MSLRHVREPQRLLFVLWIVILRFHSFVINQISSLLYFINHNLLLSHEVKLLAFNKHLSVDSLKCQFEGYYLLIFLLDLHGFLYYSDAVLLLLQTTICYIEFTLAM